MPDVVLSSGEQAALSALLAAEPIPGRPLPERRVLELMDRLIPCDAIGGFYSTASGVRLDSVDLPDGFLARLGQQSNDLRLACAGADHVDVQHLLHGDVPHRNRASGAADALHLAFRNGTDHVVDLWFGRADRPFGQRDVAVLVMVVPVLRRLVRERAVPWLPEALTVQELRVLMLVAAGCSNAEIADRLTVASSTVRKHLEHAYRKLGVTSRLGAVAALRGCDLPGLDLQARVERFA